MGVGGWRWVGGGCLNKKRTPHLRCGEIQGFGELHDLNNLKK